jgi:hypothetical protein
VVLEEKMGERVELEDDVVSEFLKKGSEKIKTPVLTIETLSKLIKNVEVKRGSSNREV